MAQPPNISFRDHGNIAKKLQQGPYNVLEIMTFFREI